MSLSPALSVQYLPLSPPAPGQVTTPPLWPHGHCAPLFQSSHWCSQDMVRALPGCAQIFCTRHSAAVEMHKCVSPPVAPIPAPTRPWPWEPASACRFLRTENLARDPDGLGEEGAASTNGVCSGRRVGGLLHSSNPDVSSVLVSECLCPPKAYMLDS